VRRHIDIPNLRSRHRQCAPIKFRGGGRPLPDSIRPGAPAIPVLKPRLRGQGGKKHFSLETQADINLK
jgi:hypothetical protein